MCCEQALMRNRHRDAYRPFIPTRHAEVKAFDATVRGPSSRDAARTTPEVHAHLGSIAVQHR